MDENVSEFDIQKLLESQQLDAAALCRAKITVDGKEHFFEHLRGTLVMERENEIWKISHMHASFPDYRNAENESFPVNL
jgi:hypothetical protein